MSKASSIMSKQVAAPNAANTGQWLAIVLSRRSGRVEGDQQRFGHGQDAGRRARFVGHRSAIEPNP
jgi:hypothetical protein